MSKEIDATEANMSAGQKRCMELLLRLHGGKHHLGRVVLWGHGLRHTFYTSGRFATRDMSQLTSLVLLAHAYRVRCEINPCNFRYLYLELHPRKASAGNSITQGHPGLADLAEMALKATQHGRDE